MYVTSNNVTSEMFFMIFLDSLSSLVMYGHTVQVQSSVIMLPNKHLHGYPWYVDYAYGQPLNHTNCLWILRLLTSTCYGCDHPIILACVTLASGGSSRVSVVSTETPFQNSGLLLRHNICLGTNCIFNHKIFQITCF